MSKKIEKNKTETTAPETTSQEATSPMVVPMEMVHLASFISLPSENKARHDLAGNYLPGSDDEQAETAYSLSQDYNPALGLISVRPVKDLAAAIVQREKEYQAILSRATAISYTVKGDDTTTKRVYTVQPAELAAMFLRIYATPGSTADKYTWEQPKFRVISGHRRTCALCLAQCFRMAQEKPLELQIPLHVTNMSDMQADIANLRENENKEVGNKAVSWREKIAAGMALLEKGYNQKYLRDIFKAGTGAKIFSICELLQELKAAGKDITGYSDNVLRSMDKETTRKQVSEIKTKRADWEAAQKSDLFNDDTRKVVKTAYDTEIAKGALTLAGQNDGKDKMLTAKVLTENLETFAPHVQDVVNAILKGKLADLQAIKAL